MTAPRDYRDFINDMVEACRAVIEFAGDMPLESYLSIDDSILFTTIHDELKPLLPRLERLMQQHNNAGA